MERSRSFVRAVIRHLGLVALIVAGPGLIASARAQEPKKTAPEAHRVPPGMPGVPGVTATPLPLRPPLKKRTFSQWLDGMMKPRPYPKNRIVRIDANHAYPCKECAEWKFIIVREDKDTVWLKPLPPEDPGSPVHAAWLREQMREAKELVDEKVRPKDFLLNFDEPVVPPPSQDAYTFTVNKSVLPTSGQWRSNFALADMNGDGNLDLVLPPPREGPYRFPLIALGNGKGSFDRWWKGLRWPNAVPFDYGGVAVADFDHDGHEDIVIGIHFKGQYVLYGNGKGDFIRWARLPAASPKLHSQTPAVADFNGDGWPDVAFLAEISYDVKTSRPLPVPTLWVVENQGGKGWKYHDEGMPERVMGYGLVATDVDGDGRPDLVMSSNANDWRGLFFFNEGHWRWRINQPDGVLSGAYHYDVVSEPGRHAALAAFQQFQWTPSAGPGGKPRSVGRSGIIQYRVQAKGAIEGKVLLMDETDRTHDPYLRLASGDLNGDGVPDLVAIRRQGQFVVLLGDGHGGYVMERSPELKAVSRPYCVQIRDLDGDGRGELIVMSADKDKQPGGIEVLSMHPVG